MSNKHYDDVEVPVLLVEQAFEALGLVIRAQDKYDPLHRADNPLPVDLLGFELFCALHVVDRVLEGHFGVLLHLFVPVLSSTEACPVLFDILLAYLLQIFCEVIQIQVLYPRVHLLGLKHDHVLLVVVAVVLLVSFLLFLILGCVVHLCVVIAVFQYFQTVVILWLQAIKDHLRQIHTRLQYLSV